MGTFDETGATTRRAPNAFRQVASG